MQFRIHFSTLLLLAAGVARGQTLPPAAPPSHADDPVSLENYVVSATPFERRQAELVSATAVLTGRDLTLKQQATLGETLAGEVGMSSTYFGPGASRPLIRGLGGDRIRILQNGVGTIDASTTSPDHAVSVEPFLVKRIEVVRGPASLLYGSSAVGGVVNVIDHRIETDIPPQTIDGQAEFRLGTAAAERAYGGMADIAFARFADGALVLHLDGFRRRTDDVDIPGFAHSAALREEEAAAGVTDFAEGTLPNSAVDSEGGSAGVSYVSNRLDVGFNVNTFTSLYGVVAEEEVKIDLHQRRIDFAAEWKEAFGPFSGARLKVGRADYEHRELEGDEVGTVFTNEGYDARLELLHLPLAGFTGAWGVQAQRSDFAAIGEEAFLPPSVTEGQALFVFEEAKQGALKWQFGARFERQSIDVADGGPSRDDDGLSGSAGAVWAFAETYAFALSVTHTERAPNAQELYSDGPHVGTNAYEIGDPSLASEKSLGVELSLRRRAGLVTGALNFFVNKFDGYIFEQATGATDPDDGLEVFQFVQRDATFHGAEIETLWHLHESDRHTLDLRIAGDLTRASEKDGPDLPRIPPMKGSVGLTWTSGALALGAEYQRIARQDRITERETETPGYGLLGVSASYRLAVGRVTYDLFARGSNLTDEEARVHASFLKEIAPLPGRNVVLGVRASF